ncbi:MAG: hypothetical protein HYR67_09630 [Bacteroidetes bacterium]|nr:hypothetical protein [Bacteroidota bacterium]
MRITFIVAFLVTGVFCLAQHTSVKNDYLFSQLTTKEGLSINEPNCVFQDSRGFIWIGTSDGLNLYTGNSIIVFRNDPKDSLTIPDNAILSIAEDKNQNLWIASGGGLTRMDLHSWKIEKVFRQGDDPRNISNSVVLFIDGENRIWTANIGIDLYDPSCDCFQHFVNQCHTDEKEFRASNLIHSLFIDQKKRMWVGTNYGIYQFDLTTKKFLKPEWFRPELSDKKEQIGPIVSEIVEDHNHQLWLATWGCGLVKFFPDQKKFTAHDIKDPQTQQSTAYDVVDHIAESKTADGKYHLWFGGNGGFGEWDETTGNFFLHQLTPDNYGGVKKIYADRSSIVWVCTALGGIYILDPYRQIFKTKFFKASTFSPAAGFGVVNSIFSEADTTWVATWYGNAIYKFDKDFNLFKKWTHLPPKNDGPESVQGNHIFRDKQGYLWISTLNGLHRLSSKTNAIKSFFHDPKDPLSLPSNKVVKYFEDSEGICWVCFYKKGICRFNPLTGKSYDYIRGPQPKNGQIFNFNVWDILEDDDGNVWFADDALGLWKYDRKEKRFIEPKNKFIKGHIASLFKDDKKNIWASTNNGLAKIKGDSIHLLTMANGLPSNNIYGAQIDNQNRLWILTNQGLARYNQENRAIRIFKQEDGLERINEVIFQKLSDGRMAIGSWHYITVFDPTKISSNENIPQVHLTQFKVFGKSIPWEKDESVKSVTLQYTQNQFSFDFTVLNYSNPSGNKFYYKMEGFNKDWISSTQGFANYTNLDPGKYRFRVKGANGDDVMNQVGDFILINIVPPFWQTKWFIIMCVLITGSIIYAVYRIRLAQLLRLERLRSKISSDLHDDMGSTLSSISILSNMALKAEDSSKQTMLSEINTNSITLMERMDDIVWSINPRNDSLDRLMVRIQNFASKLFEAKGIEYQIEVPPIISNVKLSMEHRQHVYLIMKEAVNNLVKYSKCGCARIKVSASPLLVEIHDDGIGFDASRTFQGNGIQSMNSRAKQMNAELKILSSDGAGTSVFLKIK